jgi:hypothetical protein
VRGVILLLQAAIVGLRDEDYLKAKRLLDEGFPPGSPLDIHVSMLGLAGTVVGCGLHDFQVLEPFVNLIATVGPGQFGADFWELPILVPGRLVQLVAELLSAFQNSVISYWDQPVPTGWIKRWGFMNRLEAQTQTALGAEAYQAAQERGKKLSSAEVVQEVHVFLDKVFPSGSSRK